MLPTIFPLVGRTRVRDTYNAPRGGGTRVHQGVDLPLLSRATQRDVVYPVRSPVAGTIVRVSREGPTGHPNEGNAYFIRDADGWIHLLAHLKEPPPQALVRTDVRAGQLLGEASNSGNARNTGPHLHYHIVDANGRRVNPTERLALLHAAMEEQAQTHRETRRVVRSEPWPHRMTESVNGVSNAALALWAMDRGTHERTTSQHLRDGDREEMMRRARARREFEAAEQRHRHHARVRASVRGIGDERRIPSLPIPEGPNVHHVTREDEAREAREREREESLLDAMSERAGGPRETRPVPTSGPRTPAPPVQSRPVTEAAIEQARIAVRAGRGLVEREVHEALDPSMWDLLAAAMAPEQLEMALRARATMRPIIVAHLASSRMFQEQAEAGQRGKWVASFEQLLAAHTLIGTVASSFEIARGESVGLRPVLEAVRFASEWANGALETGEGLRAAVQEGYDDIVEAAPSIAGWGFVALGLGLWWWAENH